MTPNVCAGSPNAYQPLRIAAKTYETPYLAKILSGKLTLGRVAANAGSIAHLGIEPASDVSTSAAVFWQPSFWWERHRVIGSGVVPPHECNVVSN